MSTTRIIFTAMTFFIFICANPACANGRWTQNHPRLAEVNKRFVNQNQRINQERREGEISPSQARQMHNQDRQLRQEERLIAGQNGGHLTRNEQRLLNRRENQLEKAIGQ